MSNAKILYAPGLGKDYGLLKSFRQEIEKFGYEFQYINFDYDNGPFNPESFDCMINNKADWWIGLSLGASLLYYMVNYANPRPKRLTIINPFSDRYTLSKEKGFDISKQWNFAPISTIPIINQIDLVTSIYDKSIPLYHGLELLANAMATKKDIVYVKSDHQINDIVIQNELAEALVYSKTIVKDKIYGNKYCNFYQWA